MGSGFISGIYNTRINDSTLAVCEQPRVFLHRCPAATCNLKWELIAIEYPRGNMNNTTIITVLKLTSTSLYMSM